MLFVLFRFPVLSAESLIVCSTCIVIDHEQVSAEKIDTEKLVITRVEAV